MTQVAQLDIFSAPPPVLSEHDQGREILARMDREQAAYLDELRREARHLCYLNVGLKKYGIPNTVTADDLREAKGIAPVSRHDWRRTYKNNVLGAVFKKGFECVGFYKSKGGGRHGSLIRIWRMANRAVPA